MTRAIGTSEVRDGDTIETSVVTHISRTDLEAQRASLVQKKADAIAAFRVQMDTKYDSNIAEIDRLLAIGE